MMKNVPFYLGMILCLIIGWFLTKTFTPKCPHIKSDTVWAKRDTVRFAVLPEFYFKDTGRVIINDTGRLIHDTVMSKVDSGKIHKAYFALYPRERVLIDNKDLYFKLNDTLSQNKFVGSSGLYLIKTPLQVITNTPEILRTQLFLGLGIGSNLTDAVMISGSMLLKTKKDALWNVTIDYAPQLTKTPIYTLSRYFKIKL